jgi:hypothetical protein
MIAVLHPPYFSVFPIENKTERLIFDTVDLIEAESLAVLNILTEHDFLEAVKDGRSAEKSTSSSVMMASRPIVSF